MPGFDRSGPMGAGPMTGGRRGLCGKRAGVADMPAYGRGYGYGAGMGYRRGFGGGRGRGFGPGRGGFAYPPVYGAGYPLSKTDELAMLRADAEAMQQSLETVRKRMAALEAEETK
jgi:hypothetical protein